MKKKIIKKIMIVCLSSMLLSRYAFCAKMGDANAFVTKEEFDTTLSDFNKRLSAFEAGINSKIDVQVTSYLDRNGIWNKATQSIVNNVTAKVGLKQKGVAASGYCYNCSRTPDDVHGVYLTNTYAVDKYGDGVSIKIVDKLTKNGLCMVQYTSSSNNNVTNGNLFMHSTGGTWPAISRNALLYFGWGWDFSSGGENKYRVYRALNVQYPGNFALQEQGKSNCMFFVEKGKDLVITNVANYNQSATGNYPCAYNKFDHWEQLTINSVDVY